MTGLRVWFPLLALLVPLGFLIALRLPTSDDLEGVSFDPQPLVTTPTEREVRDQQRVNVALAWEEGESLQFFAHGIRT
jgi:hypothetical protein